VKPKNCYVKFFSILWSQETLENVCYFA